MTFPTVAGTNTSTSSGTSNHSVSLPGSISAGDLLIIGLYLTDDDAGSSPTIATPSGWTQLVSSDDTGTKRLSIFYKVASGSEGASVSVSTSATGAASGAHVAYRITGYSSVPEGAIATAAGAPNPPSLTPSWGALDTLWLPFGADANDAADMTAPTNYTNIIQAFESVNSGNNLGSARRNLNAASENPGTFGGTTAGATSIAANVAVKPVTVTAATKMKYYKQRRAA